ncbi:MAG: hypothetical protein Q9M48_01545 [Rhodobacterales bacterium]|nr:hypothetical protein [Rhodobacterales bacterium]
MSDPVTKVEIEDVLSSIRRLVSEDSRPKFDRQALEKNDENSEDAQEVTAADALVLTPALRVAEYVEAVEPVETVEETNEDTAETVSETDRHFDETPADDSAEMADHQPQEWPQDQDDSTDAPETGDSNWDDSQPEVSDQGEVTAQAEEHQDDDSNAGSDAEGAYDHLTLETRIAEVEDAVADQDDQWEPDGEGQGDNAATPVEALQWEDHVEPSQDDQAAGYQGDSSLYQSPDQYQENWQGHGEDESDETQADEDNVDVISAQTDDLQDGFSHENSENAEPVTSEGQEADVDLFGVDEAIVDEDMLREMVSEIVRQELQGALGERITRNVRKLVRREIHRALASQELD